MSRGHSTDKVWFDEPALFDIPPEQPCEMDICAKCAQVTRASVDQLRAAGWLVFDGTSLTGQALHVRVCPPCQRKGTLS